MGLILSSRRKYILDGIKISTKNLQLKLRYVSGLTQRTDPKDPSLASNKGYYNLL